MLDGLRARPPGEIGGLRVTSFEDLRDPEGRMGPHKGATDFAARNVLIFRLGEGAKLVLRPSGTEPKAKAYVEVATAPCAPGTPAEAWQRTCRAADELADRLAQDFLRQSLALVDLDPSAAG
jgi:phosphoglucomutase